MAEAWRPTSKFLDSDPRSARLRDLCIPILNALEMLLVEENLSEEERIGAREQIEDGKIELMNMNITVGMNLGKPKEWEARARKDPTFAAEYAASQILELTSEPIVNIGVARPFYSEFTLERTEEADLIDFGNHVPDTAEIHMALLARVQAGYAFLGL